MKVIVESRDIIRFEDDSRTVFSITIDKEKGVISSGSSAGDYENFLKGHFMQVLQEVWLHGKNQK